MTEEQKTFADQKRKTVETAEFTEDGRYKRKVRSFVLRTGRLSDFQKNMMNDHWPDLGLDYQNAPFDFAAIYVHSFPTRRSSEIGRASCRGKSVITDLTPSRGFAAQFATAMTVVVASGTGLPISTTQTLVGAVLGIGFARGIAAINLTVIRNIFVSWVVTLPAGALFSIIIYYLLQTVFH